MMRRWGFKGIAGLVILGLASASCAQVLGIDKDYYLFVGVGGGGGGGCAMPTDCPGTDTKCQQRICTLGVCGVVNVPSGVAPAAQTAGDCKQELCDGTGGVTIAEDDSDFPVDNNQCTVSICTAGAPSTLSRPLGYACNQDGGHYCDGASKCVECLKNADCTTGACQANACMADQCFDNLKNGLETDVDCGGGQCPTCDAGKACKDNSDCVSDSCKGNLCQS